MLRLGTKTLKCLSSKVVWSLRVRGSCTQELAENKPAEASPQRNIQDDFAIPKKVCDS